MTQKISKSISEQKEAMFTLSSARQMLGFNSESEARNSEDILAIEAIVKAMVADIGTEFASSGVIIQHPASNKAENTKEVIVEKTKTEDVKNSAGQPENGQKQESSSTEKKDAAKTVVSEPTSTKETVEQNSVQTESSKEEEKVETKEVEKTETKVKTDAVVRLATPELARQAVVNEISKLFTSNPDTMKRVDDILPQMRAQFKKFIASVYPESSPYSVNQNEKIRGKLITEIAIEVIKAIKEKKLLTTNSEVLNKTLENINEAEKKAESLKATEDSKKDLTNKPLNTAVKEEKEIIPAEDEKKSETVVETTSATQAPEKNAPNVVSEEKPSEEKASDSSVTEDPYTILKTTESKDALKQALIGIRTTMGTDMPKEERVKEFDKVYNILVARLGAANCPKEVKNYLQHKEQIKKTVPALWQKTADSLKKAV